MEAARFSDRTEVAAAGGRQIAHGEVEAAEGIAGLAEVEEASAAEDQAAIGKMKIKRFFQNLEEQRVTDAIRAAEGKTSGEIRVFVSSRRLRGADVTRRAAEEFEKLGMTKTSERNGILFYFVPEDRRFAVIGDAGIHEKCGPDFWSEIASAVRARLVSGEFTEAVVEGIRLAGTSLMRHFPIIPGDRNELPDNIVRD